MNWISEKIKFVKFLSVSSENFPKLKFVNCCKNRLNKSYLKHLKNVISLESVNGYLLQPEFCEIYYHKLKEILKNRDGVSFEMEYQIYLICQECKV